MQTSGQEGPYEGLLKETIINYEALPPIPERKFPSILMQQPEASLDPGYKLSIKEDGLYRITRTELEAGGGDLSGADPTTIKVIHLGEEMPIYVAGEEDTVFDPTDYVEFYAQAINTKYTNTNIYWLTYGGEAGLRIPDRDGSLIGPVPVPTEYSTLIHLEEEHTHWGVHPGGGDADMWFWARIYTPVTSDYTDYYTASFNLDSIAPSGNCEVTVTLQGRTNTDTNPDHHTSIYLNDTQIDSQWWDGQVEFIHQVSVPQSHLVNGTNTLKVYSVGDTGSPLDQIYLNWIKIEYAHLYATTNDTLEFAGQVEGRYQYEVRGFKSSEIDLYDITDPHNIVSIINTTIESDLTYTLTFQQDEVDEPRWYLALTPDQRKSPHSIVLDSPSDLSNPANGADYIIITYDDFYDSLQPLANFRADQGLRVITAKLSDVYDEFNYGLSEPQAVKNFLKYAYHNWVAPPPTYVLLVGDATWDYKDNYGFGEELGNINFMPTYMLEASGLNEAPSDNWYVCVSGDDFLPDMFVGRISVRTAADASAVVSKIINYEQNPVIDDWNRNILLAADNEPQFERICDNLESILPSPPYLAHKVYIRLGGNTQDIIDHIDNGSLITTYVGHGNKTLWAGERLFQLSDIASLNNADRLTWVVSFTCFDGYFTHPLENYCMAEEFVRANNKGAVAAFSSTAYGYPPEHYWLGDVLYRTIFEGKNRILGSATTIAKIKAWNPYGISEDYIKTYTFFGDPASVLKIVNEAPILSVPGPQEIAEGSSLSFIVSVADPDLADIVILSASGVPSGASFDADTGILSWTPDYDQAGIYTITFIATDSWEDSDTEDVAITVTNTNRPPVAEDQLVTTDEDTPIGITLSATDPDGDLLIYSIVTQPSYGSLDGTAPNLTYTPAKNYNGMGSLTFKVNDGQVDSNIATVLITINPVNDPPQAKRARGPISGQVGIRYRWKTKGIDPDGDYVRCRFKWGDGTISKWSKLVPSGSRVRKGHTYQMLGTYNIRTQAKDETGLTSKWSKRLKVTIRE